MWRNPNRRLCGHIEPEEAIVPEKTLERMLEAWRGIIEIGAGGVVIVRDRRRLREEVIDVLVRIAVFAPSGADKEAARILVWEAARQSGLRPWSIQSLY